MRVVCKPSHERWEHDQNCWLTPGKEYTVLGIHGRDSKFKYRILSDDGVTPALHDSASFQITSPNIPEGWIFNRCNDLEWELTPVEFATNGFWESFFDGDKGTEDAFFKVLAGLDDPRKPPDR